MFNDLGLHNVPFVSPQEELLAHEIQQLHQDSNISATPKTDKISSEKSLNDRKVKYLGNGILHSIKNALTSKKAQDVVQEDLRYHPPVVQREIKTTIRSSVPTKFSRTIDAIGLLIKGIASLILSKLGKTFGVKSSFKSPQGEEGKVIKTTYLDPRGNEIGKEIIERHDGITDLINSKKQYAQYIEQQLAAANLSKEVKRSYAHELKILEHEIVSLTQYANGDTWASSGRVRSEGKAYLKGKTSQSPQKTYIPALVNHRTEIIKYEENGQSKSISISRSGALSNLSDGSTNLAKLKEEIMSETDPLRKVELQHTLDARRRMLNDQVVQYLSKQLSAFSNELNNPASLARLGNTFQMTHMSLLNPSSSKNEDGIEINEGNQMLDMAEIFKELNEKKIIFIDGIDHPFMDGDHVFISRSVIQGVSNEQWAQLKENPMGISCAFFNRSMQGKTSEEDLELQQKINLDNLKVLENNLDRIKGLKQNHPGVLVDVDIEQLESRLFHIKNVLEEVEEENKSYDFANEILLLQHDMKGAIAGSCYSGKDRTSYLLIKLAFNQLSKNLDTIVKPNKVQNKNILEKPEEELSGSESEYFFSEHSDDEIKISQLFANDFSEEYDLLKEGALDNKSDSLDSEAKRKLAKDLLSEEGGTATLLRQLTGSSQMKLRLDTPIIGKNKLERIAYGVNAIAVKN